MNIHDRNAVRFYASAVQWRRAWMTCIASVLGFGASVSAALTMYNFGRVAPAIAESQANEFFGTSSIAFTKILRSFLGPDWLIGTVCAILFVVPIVNAQWNFFRYLAEAQSTVALSEIADRDVAANESRSVATGKGTLLTVLTWASPVLGGAALVYLFATFVASPSSMSLDIRTMHTSNNLLLQFSAPFHKFSKVTLAVGAVENGSSSDRDSFDDFEFIPIVDNLSPFALETVDICFGRYIVMDETEFLESIEESEVEPIVQNREQPPSSEQRNGKAGREQILLKVSWRNLTGGTGESIIRPSWSEISRSQYNNIQTSLFGICYENNTD